MSTGTGKPEKRFMKEYDLLLAIDIGNTTVSIAVLQGKKVLEKYAVVVTAPDLRLQINLRAILKRIIKKHSPIKAAIVCSVVPETAARVQNAVKALLKIRTIWIGKDVQVPIKNLYQNPKQVGQDRLVCAYAAKCLYGTPVIVIDFGTAITFDVVSKKGHYQGGIIVPGIRLSAEALYHKTALLPRIEVIKKPKTLIGKNTQDSMLSGIFYGYGEMCRGLICRISNTIGEQPKVILTGGYTRLMQKYIERKNIIIDIDLVFKGMGLLVSKTPVP